MSFLSDLFVRIRGDKSHLDSTLDGAGQSVGNFKTKILALGAGITGALVGAFAIWKKAMESTEGTAEKLEQTMSLLHGGFQGLMRTIATGDWSNIISNITNTAEATRDLTAATQELEHATTGDQLKINKWRVGLQVAKVNAVEATDPNEKVRYLKQAIDFQKQITELELIEQNKRIAIDADYYKKLTGHTKEYYDYFMKQVPLIAGNYEYYFGKESIAIEGIQKRLSGLNYLKSLGPLTDAQEKERHQLSLLSFALEDYKIIQDDLSKKDQWDNFIKSLTQVDAISAEGEAALKRLTMQLTTSLKALKELSTIHKISEGIKSPVFEKANRVEDEKAFKIMGADTSGGLHKWNIGKNQGTELSDEQKQWVESWKRATDEVTNMISDAFINVFESIGKGSFEGFGKDLLKNFGSLIANLGKMLVSLGTTMLLALTLMKVPSIPTAIAAIATGAAAMAIGGLMMGAASKGASSLGSGGGGGGYSPQSSAIKITVEGQLKGKDIYISGRRYSNELSQGT